MMMQEHTSKLERISEPLFPNEMNFSLAYIQHLLNLLVAGTERISDADGPFEIRDVDAALMRERFANGCRVFPTTS